MPAGSTSTYLYNYVYVDNITIEPLPDCARPLSIAVRDVTGNSVTLEWEDTFESHSAWEVVYDSVGFDIDSIEATQTAITISNITTDTVLIPNLAPGVYYDFYVRTDCNGEYSRWRGPLTAAAGTYTMAKTGIDTIYACDMTIYDDGGAFDNYSASCNTTLVIYPSSPDSVISISGSYAGESCCDYLKIYDGVGTTGTQYCNIVGSNIFNILMIIGLSAIILPLQVYDGVVVDGLLTIISAILVPESLKESKCPYGLFLDLFPFDVCAKDEKTFKKQMKIPWLFSKLLILRHLPFPVVPFHGFKAKLAHVATAVVHFCMKLFRISHNFLYNKIKSISCKNNDDPNPDAYAFFCGTRVYNNYFKTEDLFPLKKLKFEDIEINFPNNLEKSLTYIYGDYMQLPPEEKRKNHFPYILKFPEETTTKGGLK